MSGASGSRDLPVRLLAVQTEEALHVLATFCELELHRRDPDAPSLVRGDLRGHIELRHATRGEQSLGGVACRGQRFLRLLRELETLLGRLQRVETRAHVTTELQDSARRRQPRCLQRRFRRATTQRGQEQRGELVLHAQLVAAVALRQELELHGRVRDQSSRHELARRHAEFAKLRAQLAVVEQRDAYGRLGIERTCEQAQRVRSTVLLDGSLTQARDLLDARVRGHVGHLR